jgi:drug/metabolite transporter (DMT)-like permease
VSNGAAGAILAPVAADAMFRRRRGVLLMVIAVTLLATMDLIVKLASAEFSTVQIAWGRYLAQSLGLLACGGIAGVSACLHSQIPGTHLIRALLLLAANVLFMAAVRYLPLAEANVIGFASPLLLTALAFPVLGERVGVRRWLAVIVGFMGVLAVVRPSPAMFHWAALLPLMMAFCAATYHIMTPWIRRTEDPAISVHYLGWVGVLATSAVVPWLWTSPSLLGWLSLAVIGGFGTLGQILMIRAFELAPPSVLAPLFYLHLIFALVYGFSVFGDVPSFATIAGALLVVASGIYVYRAT